MKDTSPKDPWAGSGGSPGGAGQFLIGFGLAMVALWFFFDSVQVVSGHRGIISGMFGGRGGGMGNWETTSMGVIFVPFFIGTVALFYDAKQKWAWGLLWIGVFIIVVEVLSRLRPQFNMGMSQLILMMVMFAAGAGLMLRSYRTIQAEDAAERKAAATPSDSKTEKPPEAADGE